MRRRIVSSGYEAMEAVCHACQSSQSTCSARTHRGRRPADAHRQDEVALQFAGQERLPVMR